MASEEDIGQRSSLETRMAALARGDRAAFDDVYNAVTPVVRAFCRKALGDADAEDATQEVVLRLFQQARDYRTGESVLAWALTVARWECRSRVRKRGRSREESGHGTEAVVDSNSESRLMHRAAIAALESLAPSDQHTILTALADDHPRTSRFRKQKQRALERLRAVWRRRHG
ncbi:MAG: sigma-70 family RNA polymerase sigma factor [Myxococcota bacterium]